MLCKDIEIAKTLIQYSLIDLCVEMLTMSGKEATVQKIQRFHPLKIQYHPELTTNFIYEKSPSTKSQSALVINIIAHVNI